MLQIDKTIISLDVLEKHFICDLPECKGECCVVGDSGAPLEPEEVEMLERIYSRIKPFLRPEGIKAIDELGTSMVDNDGDHVTPLINRRECAYTLLEGGIYKCAIERSFTMGKIRFRKPISCHLFPLKVKKYPGFDGLNYEQWEICKPARDLGNELQIPVLKFSQNPLIRRYGRKWYNKLKEAARELSNNMNK